jgi:nitrogen regulatory protein P-II 1
VAFLADRWPPNARSSPSERCATHMGPFPPPRSPKLAGAAGPTNRGGRREESRSDHQAVQLDEVMEALGEGASAADRDRGQGLRPPEGAHRALPWRGVRGRLLPKVMVVWWCTTNGHAVVDAIERTAKTRQDRRRKIFVTPVDEVVRIRTGERGPSAVRLHRRGDGRRERLLLPVMSYRQCGAPWKRTRVGDDGLLAPQIFSMPRPCPASRST